MIDLHTHILPGIDDGSSDINMTCQMLLEERKQGIEAVAATPHFYAQRESLDRFLKRRDIATEQTATLRGVPPVIVGAEVCYFEGISRTGLHRLCLYGTDALLIEMPFEAWTEHTVKEICDIACKGYIPIIAHIERYLSFRNNRSIERLLREGVLFQSDVEFFTDKRTKRQAFKMLRQEKIHFIGSDCHGTEHRKVNMGDFIEIADRSDLEYIESNQKIIFK